MRTGVSPDGWRSCGGDNRPGGMDRASLFKKQKWLNWFAAPWLFCDDFHLFQTSFTLFSFKFCFIFLLYDSFVSLSLRSTCPCIGFVWSLFTNEELLDTGNKPCYLKSSSFIEN